MSNQDLKVLHDFISGKSVALVGPSPHLEGKALGAFIDSHDVVVRVNDVSSIENAIDYGLRTDVLFCAEGSWQEIQALLNFGLEDPTLVVLPRVNEASTKLVASKPFASKVGVSLLNFDVSKLSSTNVGWPGLPSTGFLCLVSLFESPYRNLFVSGFSFYTGFRAYNKKKSARLKTLGQKRYTVSGHTIEDEVRYLQCNLPDSGFTCDEKFRRLIVEKKFRRRQPLIFVYQVSRNSVAGLARRVFSKE